MEHYGSHEDRLLTVYGKSNDVRRHLVTFFVITVASLFMAVSLFLAPMEAGSRIMILVFYYGFCAALVLYRSPQHVAIYTWEGQKDLNIRGSFNEGHKHQVGDADDLHFSVDDQCLRFQFSGQTPLTLKKANFSDKGIGLIRDALEKTAQGDPDYFNKWLSRRGIPFQMRKKNYHLSDIAATMEDYALSFRFAETSSYLIWLRLYFGICGITVALAALVAAAQHG